MHRHVQRHEKGLGAAASGTQAISERDVTNTVAPRPDVGNIQSQDPHIWPKDGHPFAPELRLDCNYVWDRMMASVARPSTVADTCAMLRDAADRTDQKIRQLSEQVSELRRALTERQTRPTDGAPPPRNGGPATPRPRIEIPPSVRRRRKVQS